MALTRRQHEILEYVRHHIADHGYAPSFEEISERFGFRSLATVHEHLTNLERKGNIRRAHNESRAIEIVPPKDQAGATELHIVGGLHPSLPFDCYATFVLEARHGARFGLDAGTWKPGGGSSTWSPGWR